ncbi:MAG: ABC transporter substrate-binding protein [Candidatus Sericytochromatia bacterium]|nr:ABC transporter substrate-binding protein [Candidatus Sericytochromatia bacterium]
MIKRLLAATLATTLASSLLLGSALAAEFKSFLETPVSNLDPLYLNSAGSRQVGQLVHRGLVAYSPTLLPPRAGAYHQVVPAIAESWELAPDKKAYIFKLNPKAHFHTGRQVRAADVKYSLERAANPNLSASEYWAVERLNIKGLRRYQAAQRAGIKEPHLLGVEVIDHDIVMITLENPIPYALELLALPIFSIVPAEDVERWWKDYSVHPVGAGPYQLEKLSDPKKISLQRFDKFYDPELPRNSGVQLSLIPETEGQFQAFTRNQLDHSPVPAAFFDKVLADPVWNALGSQPVLDAPKIGKPGETRLTKVPQWRTEFINMDNQSFPFSDTKVRQAFNWAINKRALIKDTLKTYGHPVQGIFPPGFPGASRKEEVYPHNPDKARKLLFETGWRDRDQDGDLEPWQNPRVNLTLYYGEDDRSLAICRQVQADLAAIGVTIGLAPLKKYQARYPGRLPAFYHSSWAPDIIDPSEWFYPTFHSTQRYTNRARYQNPRVDEMVGQAEDLNYEPRRYELYREAEMVILDDAPWLFLYHPVSYYLVQPQVHSYMAHPGLPFFYEHFGLQVQTAER